VGGTVPVVGDKPVFAVEFLSFRLAVMSFDNGYRVGRVEVGKFGEEQFAAELAANRIFYRDGAGLPVADFGLPRAWPAVLAGAASSPAASPASTSRVRHSSWRPTVWT